MSSLQTLIQTIVTDLINARFEADVRVAELASLYRDYPEMRQLNVPALNISNVSVELRFAFDDQPLTPSESPSEGQIKAISEGTAQLRQTVLRLDSVTGRLTTPQARNALGRTLSARLASVARETVAASPEDRRAALEAEASRLLQERQVSLSRAERSRLLEGIREIDTRITAAPKPPPQSVPGVLVGSEALSKVDPTRISTIRFDLQLDGVRWAEVEDGDDGVRSVLVGE